MVENLIGLINSSKKTYKISSLSDTTVKYMDFVILSRLVENLIGLID